MSKISPRKAIHIRLRSSKIDKLDDFATRLEISRSEFARILLNEGLQLFCAIFFPCYGSIVNQKEDTSNPRERPAQQESANSPAGQTDSGHYFNEP